MSKLFELAEDGHDPLYKALGFESPNDLSVAVANRILKAGADALETARTARTIRRERLVVVCFDCKRWYSGGEWMEGDPPPGIIESNGFCPTCFDRLLENEGKQNSLFKSVTKKP